MEAVRSKGHPIPHALRPAVTKELESEKKIGVIRPSNSPYSTPMVIASKKTGLKEYVLSSESLTP